jgi:ABC-type nitrate/sulfonate/bicarbonate transport system substrate-binding protein
MFGLSASVKEPADLIGGKAIMGTPGTRSYEQRRIEILDWSDGLVDADRDLEAIVLSGGSDAYHQALLADQVQIAAQYTRHMQPLVEAGADFFIAGIFEYPQEAIITHQDYLDDAPRTVVNFLRAWLKGQMVWRDYTMKEEIKALAKELHDMELTPEFDNAWVSQIEMMAPEGGFRSIAMKQFLDNLVVNDIIPATTTYPDFHAYEPLATAQKELLGMTWPPEEALDIFTILGKSTIF